MITPNTDMNNFTVSCFSHLVNHKPAGSVEHGKVTTMCLNCDLPVAFTLPDLIQEIPIFFQWKRIQWYV